MKCFNCGFESNDTYCAMCGTKLKDNEPQIVVISSEDGPTAYYTSAETNPYQQTHNTPPTPPQGMPTPQQYSPYPVQEVQTKKSGSALPTILAIIVSTIIVIGVIINIISSIVYKSSILDVLNDINESPENYSDDSFYEDYNTDEDSTIYSMNQPVTFKYGTIKFTEISITKEKFEYDENYRECKLTFEIENTTEKTIQLSTPSIQLCQKGDDYYEDCFEWLYDDYDSSNSDYAEFKLNAGETKTFVSYYKIPNTITDFSLLVDLYDSEFTYDFICYFETSLPQTETTAPATQKDN